MEFRVLGPLEAWAGGQAVQLGGAKQRAVLALLLLRAGEVVSVERLIDEVWDDNPPPSAAHSLEAYVSRLRRLLAPYGPSLVRRGAGYSLDLGGAVVDEQVFAQLLDDSSHAAMAGDHARAAELATEALALWRGPALADVALGPAGQAEAHRLEELRLRALEQRFEAQLELGRHEELAGELQLLVSENPYRERFVAQLMLAHYRSGRHADALDAYEKTRAAMDRDLGLQPSSELQQLSGQIVRQEPLLSRPARRAPERTRARARSALVVAGALTVAAMALTASGSASNPAGAASFGSKPARYAFVLPKAPSQGRPGVLAEYVERFRLIVSYPKVAHEMIIADDSRRDPATLAAVAARLRDGDFDLVLWVGDGPAARALAPLVRALRDTEFVFVDASLETLKLVGVDNASAFRFAEEQSSELAGYASGLVSPRGLPRGKRADVVSVVAGFPTPNARRAVAGFQRGVRRALPGVKVLVAYSHDLVDKTRCEQIANSQIDKGSDVVFATAGTCGLGALAVTSTRGVWGVGDAQAEQAGAELRSRLLVHTDKDEEMALDVAASSFVRGRLPVGKDRVLGLEDNYAVGISDINYEVPPWVGSKVVGLCSKIRAHTQDDAT